MGSLETDLEAERRAARVGRRVGGIPDEFDRQVADEFDSIHTIERALRVGSVDRIIAAAELRPYVVDALERGIARDV